MLNYDIHPNPDRCIVVVGGGAAGIFAALHAKEAQPEISVVVLEKSAVFLSKVRISGGGRCNVTHACFDPQALIRHYPRGGQELLGPFHRFQPKDTIAWYESRGVGLKTENDGRIFPITNRSQTIVDALLNEACRLQVELRTQQNVTSIDYQDNLFHIHIRDKGLLTCRSLILATGSSREGYLFAQSLQHTIASPVPSLFGLNIPDCTLRSLSGVAIRDVTVSLPEISTHQRGALLITHFGLSGPAILKLSAWAAKELYSKNYRTQVQINWVPEHSLGSLKAYFNKLKSETPSKMIGQIPFPYLPKSLWKTLITPWTHRLLAHISDRDLDHICQILHANSYQMDGKTPHKEEFVTCGGVLLNEIDFRTMQSKWTPRLFFVGELLNIDGVTGGFNFQNAWTTGYLAGQAAANQLARAM